MRVQQQLEDAGRGGLVWVGLVWQLLCSGGQLAAGSWQLAACSLQLAHSRQQTAQKRAKGGAVTAASQGLRSRRARKLGLVGQLIEVAVRARLAGCAAGARRGRAGEVRVRVRVREREEVGGRRSAWADDGVSLDAMLDHARGPGAFCLLSTWEGPATCSNKCLHNILQQHTIPYPTISYHTSGPIVLACGLCLHVACFAVSSTTATKASYHDCQTVW